MTSSEIIRGITEAFNSRDFDRARELVGDDLSFRDYAMGVTIEGGDGFVDYARAWAGAFSDMRLDLKSVVGDDSHVAGEFVARGTHDGTLPSPTGDIPATGKEIETHFVWYASAADGKLTALGDYYDAMTIMTQLGLVPEPAEATA